MQTKGGRSVRSLLRRLCSVEVVGGAALGAMAPYLISLATRVALVRVPIGLVVVTMALGGLLGWLIVFAAKSFRRWRRTARERRDRERQTLKAQLERIERAVLARADRESGP